MLPIVAAAVALNLSWAPADNCAHTFGFISDGQRQREINNRNVVEKRSARSADHDHHQQRLVRQALGQTHGQTDRQTDREWSGRCADRFLSLFCKPTLSLGAGRQAGGESRWLWSRQMVFRRRRWRWRGRCHNNNKRAKKRWLWYEWNCSKRSPPEGGVELPIRFVTLYYKHTRGRQKTAIFEAAANSHFIASWHTKCPYI